jgi:hypothetical protein
MLSSQGRLDRFGLVLIKLVDVSPGEGLPNALMNGDRDWARNGASTGDGVIERQQRAKGTLQFPLLEEGFKAAGP